MKIGPVSIAPKTVFAPLAGISDLPLRLMAKEAGCGLVCSEMISANGLIYHQRKTWRMLESAPQEKPLSVQIFGSVPEVMADAARMVQASGADMVDLNLGCSVKKVLKTGAGAALMRCPAQAQALFKVVRAAVTIPVTVKFRTGWDPSGDQAVEIARQAEACGVDALCIHPRTATQGFRGRADWSVITRVKRQVGIPVIGNGDINCADDAVAMLSQTGCDAVMVGRAAIGNPAIFRQILDKLAGRDPIPPTIEERFEVMGHYLEAAIRHWGEERACYQLRSRLCWFVKGMPRASHFRQAIRFIDSRQAAQRQIEAFRRHVC